MKLVSRAHLNTHLYRALSHTLLFDPAHFDDRELCYTWTSSHLSFFLYHDEFRSNVYLFTMWRDPRLFMGPDYMHHIHQLQCVLNHARESVKNKIPRHVRARAYARKEDVV